MKCPCVCVCVFVCSAVQREKNKTKKVGAAWGRCKENIIYLLNLKLFCFVSFSKLHHGICYCINTEASASICISARNASLYIAVMIFCAQPYLKPCFMCPFYILSTCPSKGLCTALVKCNHKYVNLTEWNSSIVIMRHMFQSGEFDSF